MKNIVSIFLTSILTNITNGKASQPIEKYDFTQLEVVLKKEAQIFINSFCKTDYNSSISCFHIYFNEENPEIDFLIINSDEIKEIEIGDIPAYPFFRNNLSNKFYTKSKEFQAVLADYQNYLESVNKFYHQKNQKQYQEIVDFNTLNFRSIITKTIVNLNYSGIDRDKWFCFWSSDVHGNYDSALETIQLEIRKKYWGKDHDYSK